MVLPESSTPLFLSRLHFPNRISLSAIDRRLNRLKIIPKECSPTACLFPSGAEMRAIFFLLASLQFMLSSPAPERAMNFRWALCSMNSLSIGNRERITRASYAFIFFKISIKKISLIFLIKLFLKNWWFWLNSNHNINTSVLHSNV